VFRRRRQAGENQPMSEGRMDMAPAGEDERARPGDVDPDDQYLDDEYADDGYPGDQEMAAEHDEPAGQGPGAGPWDSRERYPQRQRVDLGSLLIPVNPDQEVQLNVAGEQIVAASVTFSDSALQVQAFAAPKSGGLWDDVRDEIAEEIRGAGGQSRLAEGPFGTELEARVPTEPGGGPADLQPARYIGVDGPRWLLRGTISGQAASHAELARPLEEVFADIVVVRGDHPAPPRDLLEIQLPAEMREAIEEEMAQAEERGEFPNPFDRGPEITETR
jgi:Protein of unknown function (DUF3710)